MSPCCWCEHYCVHVSSQQPVTCCSGPQPRPQRTPREGPSTPGPAQPEVWVFGTGERTARKAIVWATRCGGPPSVAGGGCSAAAGRASLRAVCYRSCCRCRRLRQTSTRSVRSEAEKRSRSSCSRDLCLNRSIEPKSDSKIVVNLPYLPRPCVNVERRKKGGGSEFSNLLLIVAPPLVSANLPPNAAYLWLGCDGGCHYCLQF